MSSNKRMWELVMTARHSAMASFVPVPFTQHEESDFTQMAVGGDIYQVKSTLLSAVTNYFDLSENFDTKGQSSSLTQGKPHFVFSSECSEGFQLFLYWLSNEEYRPESIAISYRDASIENGLQLLASLYDVAKQINCPSLKHDVILVLVDALEGSDDYFFQSVKTFYDIKNPSSHELIGDMLKEFCESIVKIGVPTGSSVKSPWDAIVGLYIWNIQSKWKSDRLLNILVDTIRALLLASNKFLGKAQLNRIFRDTKGNEDRARLREFCFAQCHYQRFNRESRNKPPGATSSFCSTPSWVAAYLQFEEDVMAENFKFLHGLDPRVEDQAEFDRCYFHFHDPDDHCHTEDLSSTD